MTDDIPLDPKLEKASNMVKAMFKFEALEKQQEVCLGSALSIDEKGVVYKIWHIVKHLDAESCIKVVDGVMNIKSDYVKLDDSTPHPRLTI